MYEGCILKVVDVEYFEMSGYDNLAVNELPKMRNDYLAIRRALNVSRNDGVSSMQYIDLLSALYRVKRAFYKEFDFYHHSDKNEVHKQRMYFVSNIFITLMDQWQKLPYITAEQDAAFRYVNDDQYMQDIGEPLMAKIALAKSMMKLVEQFYCCHSVVYNNEVTEGICHPNSFLMEITGSDIKKGFLVLKHDFTRSKPEFKKVFLHVVNLSINASISTLQDLQNTIEIMYLRPQAEELSSRKRRLQDNQKAAAAARTKYPNEIKERWLCEAAKLKSLNKNLSINAVANKLEKNNLGDAQSIRRYLAKHKI